VTQNYYEVLGVDESAEIEVIKAAHRALAKKYHPDIFVGDKNYAEEKLKSINVAFEVLSNSKKRKEYDEKIKSESKGSSFNDKEDFDTEKGGEPVLKEDWKILIEVFPEAEKIRQQIARYSSTLSFTYQILLLTSKGASHSEKLAEELEKSYFEKHFGKNKKLHALVKKLLLNKKRHIAKEINKKVASLGTEASERIIREIQTKYADEFRENPQTPMGSSEAQNEPNPIEKPNYLLVSIVMIICLIAVISSYFSVFH
tara:strand:- start:1412 stop:2182 length:771 start_codon:yes stop_codon:yes gene_type:complete